MHLCCARQAGTAAQQDHWSGCSACTPFHCCGRCLSHHRAHSRPCSARVWGEPISARCWRDLFSACGPLDHGGFSHHNNKEYSGSSSAHLGWHAARPVISLCLRAFWLVGCWLGAWNSSEASTTHAAAAAAAALPPAAAAAARPHPPAARAVLPPAACAH